MSERAMARAVLERFDEHRRDLPWRRTADPYAIWVSEVMLQQTRVETVVPYYQRWLERFPTVAALAGAATDDVLREWQGLGYYSRARNLQRAARLVRERHGGRLPRDPSALRELPGVGEYTAGAVASIAYGARVPAVDGNVRRVLARVYDLERPTAAELRRRADDLVPPDRPGDFNQALMELGATICTPRAPSCPHCPLAAWCQARRLGVQEQRPVPRPRGPVPHERVVCHVLVRDDGATLLVRRPEDGLLGGMWEFPGEPGAAATRPEVASWVRAGRPVADLEPVQHTFSHKRITYEPRLLRLDPDPGAPRAALEPTPTGDVAWVDPADLAAFPLPVAQQRIAGSAGFRLLTR